MTGLVRYDAACKALAECKAIDEVKDWHDKAAAMQAYGKMAKDKTLEVDAAEIRIRAERRLGEMLSKQKSEGGLNRGNLLNGRSEDNSSAVVVNDRRRIPTLADVGISKDLSSRAQKLAAVPEDQFEHEVGEWRERVEAENARVTARLQKAGEIAQGATEESEIDRLRKENAELKEANAEQGQTIKELIADNNSMALVFEANDQLAAAIKEAKMYMDMNRTLEARIVGLMNEKNEAVRIARTLKRKLEKLESCKLN